MKQSAKMSTLFFVVIIFAFSNIANGQTYLYEDFEDGSKPAGWTYEYVKDVISWQYLNGGYSTTGTQGTGKPPYAKEGEYNAMFHRETFTGPTTKLVTPAIDLEFGIKPELSFWHAQEQRYTLEEYNNDELRVYYKEHEDSSWVLLAEYTDRENIWVERNIQLPDSALTSTFYIAFEGKSNNGYGTCIDSVAVVEKGIIPRYVEDIDIVQASTEFVATESSNNPILRIDFSVKGNDGIIKLDSLAAVSLNTDDSDLATNGVKLFASNDNNFGNSAQIASGVNFSNGEVTFDNINRSLPTGLSSVWITYDMAEDLDHDKHEHILDAKILKESIKVNDSYYPIIDKSPDGKRTIYESILYSDFESPEGWNYTGEFERDLPQGLGGNYGNADPDYAVSGNYIIGTDLTGLGDYEGDYEFEIGDREYSATSGYINCKYYKDTYVYFDRWLNVDAYDTSRFEINTSKADNWQTQYINSGTVINSQWTRVSYNVDNKISRQDSVAVRFSLGPTNNFWNFSGWNIDNVIIVGNYIGKDVTITEWLGPYTGCGNTSEEYVTVKIKNLAGEPMDDPLPISYSFDEGETIYYDTIDVTIAVDDSLTYTIDKPFDLSTPGWYYNVYAETHLAGDEDNTNNKITTDIFNSPTYTPPYTQRFETNYGYYLTGGTNSSWEYGEPNNVIIDTAASGTKAWVTSLLSYYNEVEESYIESPCFDLSQVDYPVIEFKANGLGLDTIAGIAAQYSLDEGETWTLVADNDDYYWNWYNEENIRALGTAGIDSTDGWQTFRQMLPNDLKNHPLVKFRIVFANDSSATKEGFGVDDIKIYDAPADVGASSLYYPVTQCELSDTTHVQVYITNYGLDTLETGKKIPVGLNFKSNYICTDTLTLVSNLLPNDSVLFQFDTTVDMSYSGDYSFNIYTKLESNPYFYNDTLCNDTLLDTITVQGMPRYNPWNYIIGDNPVDTTLDAGAGYDTYEWQDASTNQTYDVSVEGIYRVTVTNSYGCTAVDSAKVMSSLADLTMDTVFTVLKDSCERNDLTEISVQFINNGYEDYAVGDTIFLAYKINNEDIVEDIMILTTELPYTYPPSDTAEFTFSQECDFTNPGEYTLKVFTNFPKDLNHNDDTLTFNFNTWGYVNIGLEYDTIYSSKADTLELSATPDTYTSYSWNSGETTASITPSNESYYYKVTATDGNICGSSVDSTYIETYDFGITSINGFDDTCDYNFSTDTAINVTVKNYSDNAYDPGDLLTFYYKYDENSWVDTTITLTEIFGANSSKNFNIGNIDATEAGSHSIEAYTYSERDANTSNDSASITFEVWPYPTVELTYDTIFTTKTDTITLSPTSGWASYTWNTGDSTETLDVTHKSTLNYIVEVADKHGCGTAKDSTLIITYNLGVSDMIYPKNDCEHTTTEDVIVTVENFSYDTISAGDYIDVTYEINEGTPVTESFLLEADLRPSSTFDANFSQKADLSAVDTFYIKSYTTYPLEARKSNDTLFDAIRTYGYPTIELGNDIFSKQADTVEVVVKPGFVKYNWNNGTSNDTLSVTYPATYEYIVTVTNINGCSTSDSLTVFTYDVGVDSINAPATTCTFTDKEIVRVHIINNSEDTLQAGQTINVSYSINGAAYVSEVHTLAENLLPDSIIIHEFTDSIDLTTNSTHNFSAAVDLTNDVYTLNDTLTISIEEVGYPAVDLGDDIYTQDPTGTVLSAPGGYDSYLWQDNSTNQDYTISYTASALYSVTVTDIYGCEGYDTVNVYTYDVGVDSINAPATTCVFTTKEPVVVFLKNSGPDTLLAGQTMNVSYSLDGAAHVSEVHTLAEDLFPDSISVHQFTDSIDLTTNSTHSFSAAVELANDAYSSNDTLNINIEEVGYPAIDLGDDIYTQDPTGTVLSAPGGYDNYLWQDNSTNQDYTISYTASALYSVTVTDIYGCEGYDTMNVYTYDVGVDSVNAPATTCVFTTKEPVVVVLKNSGPDTLLTGQIMNVSYSLDGATYVSEVHTLAEDLLPDSISVHQFTDSIDLTTNATHDFSAAVELSNDVVSSNDTLEINIKEVGYPVVDLGDDISTTDPTGTILTAPSDYASYLWQDNSTTDTYTINYPASATYSVTVADIYGCEGYDTVEVYTYNLAADSLIAPTDQCSFTAAEDITIGIINNGNDTLSSGSSIQVAYQLNSEPFVIDTFDLSAELYPDSLVEYTFSTQADMSVNQTHQFKLFARYNTWDVYQEDTITRSADYLADLLDLGNDTTTDISPYTIDAGAGFTSYLWFDSSTERYYDVDVNSQTTNHYYAVTVTNDLGCESVDSLMVTFTINPDIGVTELISPVDKCLYDSTYDVTVEITNLGALIIPSGTSFNVGYMIDEGTPVSESITLSAHMIENDSIIHTFANQVGFERADTFEFAVYTLYGSDGTSSNDTLLADVIISEADVDLGPDTLYVESFPHYLNAGEFETYLWNTGSTERTLQVNSPGTYSVTVTDINGCEGSDSIYVDQAESDGNIISTNEYIVEFYPNPVNQELTMLFNCDKPEDFVIDLYSVQGVKVYTYELNRIKDFVHFIDVTRLPSGVYYIVLTNQQNRFTRKIIVN